MVHVGIFVMKNVCALSKKLGKINDFYEEITCILVKKVYKKVDGSCPISYLFPVVTNSHYPELGMYKGYWVVWLKSIFFTALQRKKISSTKIL